MPTRTTRAWATNKTSHIQDSQMFFRSSNSDASVKEPSRTLNPNNPHRALFHSHIARAGHFAARGVERLRQVQFGEQCFGGHR